jgi:hypothetical protein
MLFDAIEKLGRAHLGIAELGAAGMLLPKSAHPLFQFIIAVLTRMRHKV